MQKQVSYFLASSLLLISTVAHAEYVTEWRGWSSVVVKTMHNIMRNNFVGNTAEQAAELAASNCSNSILKLEAQGYKVLAYRGNAIPTASPYLFSGNCDAQVLTK